MHISFLFSTLLCPFLGKWRNGSLHSGSRWAEGEGFSRIFCTYRTLFFQNHSRALANACASAGKTSSYKKHSINKTLVFKNSTFVFKNDTFVFTSKTFAGRIHEEGRTLAQGGGEVCLPYKKRRHRVNFRGYCLRNCQK